MDEKTILLMSEELRAALGERVSKIEADPPQHLEDASVIRAACRILRVSSLRDGGVLIRLKTKSETIVPSLLRSASAVHLLLEDEAAEYRIHCRARSVKATLGSEKVVTICVDRAA